MTKYQITESGKAIASKSISDSMTADALRSDNPSQEDRFTDFEIAAFYLKSLNNSGHPTSGGDLTQEIRRHKDMERHSTGITRDALKFLCKKGYATVVI